jgi:hypothetical protein
MLSPDLASIYPGLTADKGKNKSPKTSVYNCVAWAAAWDKTRWWQPDTYEPGMYWPHGISKDGSIACFISLFESLSYRKCNSSDMEILFEKVAIYESPSGDFMHVAREINSGTWWSKLGEDEDIFHNSPKGLEGTSYGTAKYFLKRRCGFLNILARIAYKAAALLSFGRFRGFGLQ